MKILVVEDDLLVADALRSTLSSLNYAVEVAHDGRAGLDCIEAFNYDLLVLDVVLPKIDGIALCHHVRSQGYMMPILLLTSRDSNHDRAVGLDAGADDYAIKPFDPEDLSARIRALLRRGNDNVQPILTWKDLTLNPRNCEVTYLDRVLTLTPKEYALLELFLRHNRRLFSCGAILEHLWTYEDTPSEEAVRTHIKGLRQKLKAVGAPHNLVETVYGIGYRLKSADPLPLQQVAIAARTVPNRGNNSATGASQLVTSIPQVAPMRSSPPAHLATSTLPSATASDSSGMETNGTTVATSALPPMLAEIWNRHYDQMIDRVESIECVLVALADRSLTPQARLQAWQSAHTLAGALGTFGLPLGSQAAKQIELLLDVKTELTLAQLPQLQTKVADLRREISSKMVIPKPEIAPSPPIVGGLVTTVASASAAVASDRSMRLLVITKEPDLVRSLRDASAAKFELAIATELVLPTLAPAPAAIVLDLECFAHSRDGLMALSALERDYPTVPVLVLSQFDRSNGLPSVLSPSRLGGSPAQWYTDYSSLLEETSGARAAATAIDVAIRLADPTGAKTASNRSQQLHQRVEVARRGGRMFLSKPVAAGEILQAIDRVLHQVTVKQASITIVDDDRVLLEGLTVLLSRSNMLVTTLSEPSRFWETLEASKPDLLILDLDMPTYNGIELCRAVRTDPQWATLPIMFLTAHAANIAIDRVFAAGADDFVTKPAIAAELVARIVNRLERIEQRSLK